MKLELLIENHQEPVPSNVNVTYEFDSNLRVIMEDNSIKVGRHCIVEAKQSDMVSWLSSSGQPVMVGSGVPQMQSFRLRTIKPELV